LAVPQDYLFRLHADTDFDNQYKNATLKVSLAANFHQGNNAKVNLTLKNPKGRVVTARFILATGVGF